LSSRFVCIHGHFYQPPRENPWLEAVELQDSAYPYHDWNERITAECYGPNATPRILDGQNRIVRIENNYARMSFNFGPTLLSWMEAKVPDVYAAILEADRESRTRFSGHGAALAQVYNHVILPLASRRDKVTEVRWGVADFTRRFGREPEGMWLPETAVDVESLEVLAEHGLAFTILAPHQAGRVRRLGEEAWQDVTGGRVDPRRPYRVALPSGRSIAVFFYDAPVSRGVAFERLLDSGELLVRRLLGAFDEEAPGDQLVHIATDGETYGHHHRFGDMALAYALHHLEEDGGARLTIYGEYLAAHPPEFEAEIVENTSWSCSHGVGRWKEDCGCRTLTGSRQGWRAPLRQAFDGLRDATAPLFEAAGGELLKDPWAARDDSIAIILDRSEEGRSAFLSRHARRTLLAEERTRVLCLLELERHALLMYTSCGWFFDDVSGLEAQQDLQYAGRVVDLSERLFHAGLEAGFLEQLAAAPGALPGRPDGRQVYRDCVLPARVDLEKVGAHYAVSSLFKEYAERDRVYCYAVERLDFSLLPGGRARLALGRARIVSEITGESDEVSFCVLHLGDHNVSGGIGRFASREAYEEAVRDAEEAFGRGDLAAVLRLVDRSFSSETYSLKLLFRDEQRQIVAVILTQPLAAADAAYRKLYDRNLPLLRFLHDHGIPVPRGLHLAAEMALTLALRHALDADPPDLSRIAETLAEAGGSGFQLAEDGLGLAFRRAAERLARRWQAAPESLAAMSDLHALVTFGKALPFPVEFWNAQNLFYGALHSVFPPAAARAAEGDPPAREWVAAFRQLGEKLAVFVPE
jgi:alpha-amylase/alpha-mannosidase (GH57 family)